MMAARRGAPSCLALPGELDDEDRVLAREPRQHQEADLGENVVVAAGQPDAADRREQGHRHDQDHRERQRQALVLRGQHAVDEQHAERKDQEHGVAGDRVLVGELRPLERHAVRQHALEQAGHRGLGLPRAVPRRGSAVDLGGRKTVVMHHLVRAVAAAHLEHRAERHHLAPVVARLQAGDLLRLQPERRLRLHVDLIGPSEAVEVVRVERSEIDLQGVEHVGQRDAVGLHPLAVHVDVDLRHADLEAGEQPGERGIALAGRRRGLDLFVQLLEPEPRAVLHVQLEAADRAQSLHGRRREDGDERSLDGAEPLVELADDVLASIPGCRARSSDGLRVTKATPVFGALTKPLIDSPGNATALATPGCASASADIWRITLSVRSSVAPSGSWAKATR